jgi:hypothetical protein
MSVIMLSVVMLNVVAQMKLTSSAKTIIWKQLLLDGSINPICKNETLLKVSYNGKQSTVNKSLDGSMYPG